MVLKFRSILFNLRILRKFKMMRTISLRNAYKVIGSEPSPYTNKVYAYMRYKNIPFVNVPGWFPIKNSRVYRLYKNNQVDILDARTFLSKGGLEALA